MPLARTRDRFRIYFPCLFVRPSCLHAFLTNLFSLLSYPLLSFQTLVTNSNHNHRCTIFGTSLALAPAALYEVTYAAAIAVALTAVGDR